MTDHIERNKQSAKVSSRRVDEEVPSGDETVYPASPKEEPDAVLIIHGTGAADNRDEGDKWWQRGGLLWRALDERLAPKACCYPSWGRLFHWSGANRERERLSAARDLLAYLQTLEDSRRRYHIIAHSHGGSIVRSALRSAALKGKRLSYLGSWVTLGTPFLELQPRWGLMSYLLPLGVLLGQLHWGGGIVRLTEELSTYRDLWHGEDTMGLVGIGAIWLLTAILASVAVAMLIALLRGIFRAQHASKGDRRLIEMFGRRWINLWSPDDEAINGLRATLMFGGRVAPRLRATSGSPVKRFLSTTWAPARFVYNSLIAPLSDDFIWQKLARTFQGMDEIGLFVTSVGGTILPESRRWQIDGPLNQVLLSIADEAAGKRVGAARHAFGAIALCDDDLPLPLARVAQVLEGDELVHWQYYQCPQSIDQLAEIVLAGEERMEEVKPPVRTVHRPSADRLRLSAAGAGVLAAVALLAGVGERSLYVSQILPYTLEYQKQVVVRDAPVVEAAASGAVEEAEAWARTLARTGEGEAAFRQATGISDPKALLGTLIGLLEGMRGRRRGYQGLDARILSKVREAAPQVNWSDFSGNEAEMLVARLSTEAVLRGRCHLAVEILSRSGTIAALSVELIQKWSDAHPQTDSFPNDMGECLLEYSRTPLAINSLPAAAALMTRAGRLDDALSAIREARTSEKGTTWPRESAYEAVIIMLIRLGQKDLAVRTFAKFYPQETNLTPSLVSSLVSANRADVVSDIITKTTNNYNRALLSLALGKSLAENKRYKLAQGAVSAAAELLFEQSTFIPSVNVRLLECAEVLLKARSSDQALAIVQRVETRSTASKPDMAYYLALNRVEDAFADQDRIEDSLAIARAMGNRDGRPVMSFRKRAVLALLTQGRVEEGLKEAELIDDDEGARALALTEGAAAALRSGRLLEAGRILSHINVKEVVAYYQEVPIELRQVFDLMIALGERRLIPQTIAQAAKGGFEVEVLLDLAELPRAKQQKGFVELLLDIAARKIASIQDPSLRSKFTFRCMELLVTRGDVNRAGELARRGVESARQVGDDEVRSTLFAYASLAYVNLRKFREARLMAERCTRSSDKLRGFRRVYSAVVGIDGDSLNEWEKLTN
jgi:hypothetical protein